MAAQCKRIAVAGRQLADAEQAGKCFQLVGDGDGAGNVVLRQLVTGEAWLVVFGDGVGDRHRLAIVQRIVATHDALQFRELADHAGDQIGLGETGGATGGNMIRPQCAGDCAGQLCDALNAFQL